jgi:UDP-N-acetylenolpyruvoylglucosamine reductase
VALAARDNHLTGLEFLEGIPGTLGGALRMNAGAMGSSIFDVVRTVRYMDRTGAIHEAPASAMDATYRRCEMLRDNIALGATLHGVFSARGEVQTRMEGFSQRRWASQPAAPSAGCMFKNPEAVPAGKLIDELGLKGTRVGGAVVSAEHGNFIVNDRHATARDVLALIEQIRSRVRELRGISLETEVQITGEE